MKKLLFSLVSTLMLNDGGFPVHIARDGLTVIDYCE